MVKLAKCFSENLQRFRKEAGMSQEDLGKAIDSTRQAITRYESGESSPSFEVIERLAELLNVDADELLFSEKTKKRLGRYEEFLLDAQENRAKRTRALFRRYDEAAEFDPNARIVIDKKTHFFVSKRPHHGHSEEVWEEISGDTLDYIKNLLKK